MSLKEARTRLISALRQGRFEHEPREVLAEKNLLAIGEVGPEEVITMLQRTRGDQYKEAQHHWDAEVTVRVFTPEVGGVRWYIKAYFLEGPQELATFISVHR